MHIQFSTASTDCACPKCLVTFVRACVILQVIADNRMTLVWLFYVVGHTQKHVCRNVGGDLKACIG